MSFKAFRKQILDLSQLISAAGILRVINSLQAAIEDSLAPMIAKIQNDSNIISNVSLKTGQINIVNHRLDRKLLGWEIVRLRSEADIWDSQDQNASPNLTLLLNCSADCVVDILVF